MAIKWNDTTSYSRGKTVDDTPRTWQSKVGDVQLVVTRYLDYEPDVWVIEAEPFVSRRPARSKDLEKAKKELVREVRIGVNRLLMGLS